MLFSVSFRALTMYLILASLCQTSSSLKEGTKMDARWSYQYNTEHVHYCFKFGRLAGLVMVLIMSPCIQAKPRVQCPYPSSLGTGHNLESHSHWILARSQPSNTGPLWSAVRVSRAVHLEGCPLNLFNNFWVSMIGELWLDNNPPFKISLCHVGLGSLFGVSMNINLRLWQLPSTSEHYGLPSFSYSFFPETIAIRKPTVICFF